MNKIKQLKMIAISIFITTLVTTISASAAESIFLRFLVNDETWEFDFNLVESDTGWGNNEANHLEAKEFNSDELSINKYGYMTKFDDKEADNQGDAWDLDTQLPYPNEYFDLPDSLYGKTLDESIFFGGSLGKDKDDRKISDQGIIDATGTGNMLIFSFPAEYIKINSKTNDVTNNLNDQNRIRSDYVGKTLTYNLNALVSYITKGKGFNDYSEFKATMLEFVKDVGKEYAFEYNEEIIHFYIGKPTGTVENSEMAMKAKDNNLSYIPDQNNKGELYWYVWRGNKKLNELNNGDYFRTILSVPKGYKEAFINNQEQKVIDQKLFQITKDTTYLDARQVILYSIARYEIKGDSANFVALEEQDDNFFLNLLASLFYMVQILLTKFLGPIDATTILTSGTEDGFSTFFTPEVAGFMLKVGLFTNMLYLSLKGFMLIFGALSAKLRTNGNPDALKNHWTSVQQSFKGIIVVAIANPIMLAMLGLGNVIVNSALWFFAKELGFLDNSISRIGFFFISFFIFFRYMFRAIQIVAHVSVIAPLSAIRIETEKNDAPMFEWLSKSIQYAFMPVSDLLLTIISYGTVMSFVSIPIASRYLVAPFMAITIIKVLDPIIYRDKNEAQDASEQAGHALSSATKGTVSTIGTGMVIAGNGLNKLSDKLPSSESSGTGTESISNDNNIKRGESQQVESNIRTKKKDYSSLKTGLNAAGSITRQLGESTRKFGGIMNVADGITHMDIGKGAKGINDIKSASKQQLLNTKDDLSKLFGGSKSNPIESDVLETEASPIGNVESSTDMVKSDSNHSNYNQGVSKGVVMKSEQNSAWVDSDLSKQNGLEVTERNTMKYDMNKINAELKHDLNTFDSRFTAHKANGTEQEFLKSNGIEKYTNKGANRIFKYNREGLNELGFHELKPDKLGDKDAFKLTLTSKGTKGARAFISEIKEPEKKHYRKAE